MSNLRLFEIDAAIAAVSDMMVDPETGEILDAEEVVAKLDELEMDKERKIEYITKEIKNLKAEAEIVKAQKSAFDKRLKATNNKVSYLENYLQLSLGGEKWKAKDGSVSISYRNTKNVVNITDLTSIPEEYFKTPHTESNINKTQLKDDILNGKSVAGAELINKTSLIIK